MNAKPLISSLMLAICTAGSVEAYDNGPEVVGCDFKFGDNEGTDKCLVLGSGMGQGISWTVFEVRGKRFRHSSSSPNKLELLNAANEKIKSYLITNMAGQCRPGGQGADIYSFDNGDRICLYW